MASFDEIFDAAGVDRSRAPSNFSWSDLRRVASYQGRRIQERNDLIRALVSQYEALQETDGAGAFLDYSDTFTAGHWVAARLAGLIEECRDLLEKG